MSTAAPPLAQLWDIGKSECVSTVRAHTSDVYSVRMHPNGTHFVSGGYDKTVRLFDARTGTEMKSLKGHKLVRVLLLRVLLLLPPRLPPAAWQVMSTLAVAACRWVARAHPDVGSAIDVGTILSQGVSQAIFNYYGNLIVSGSKDGTVKIWDITSGAATSTSFSTRFSRIISYSTPCTRYAMCSA